MSEVNKATAPTEQSLQPVKKNITDQVLAKITAFQGSGELRLPNNYSAENALKSAWLVLQETKDRNGNFALTFCTQESIANALLKMVVWGLSPLKKQCDFIMYGNKLSCDPEYTGNLVLAKRYAGLKDHNKGRSIHKGDVFVYETSSTPPYRKKLIEHTQTLETLDAEVIGSYWCYVLEDGTEDMEIMTIAMIRKAWAQGAAKGNSGAHNNFTDQMANKTVINRGCKLLIRASDDAALYDKDDSDQDTVSSSSNTEILNKANKEELNFTEHEEIPNETVSQPEPTKENSESANPI